MLLLLNILYVLVAVAMIALILMQRGAGAQAGSGFGGGASATVFGARGASSFLSKATKWLAITFFAISLFMAWYATSRSVGVVAPSDLGVMSQVPVVPAPAPAGNTAVPVAPAATPAVQAHTVPAAPVGSSESPESAPPDPTEK